jgi:predicted alpha-1,2-mannosidase
MKRSQNWKNLYNPKTGFIQPRKNGNWYEPFDPREVNNNYTEGNSALLLLCTAGYSGTDAAHGGKDKFEQFIDAIFAAPDKTTGREQVDITGLMGQYAQGNEPSHHIAYLYNFVDKPEKTDAKIKYILDNFYKNTPDGLIGNEDCGQMSAWYVLSAMGIYSVTPGLPEWETTTPYFDEIKIHLEDGTTRTITKNTGKAELKKLGFENINPGKDFKYSQLTAAPVIAADRILILIQKLKSLH